ncbi:Eukaryotic translation initiation factor 2 subunit 3, partial [Datura stramonium]|nr:Eukaryotic translation initiation factor 2 subunit 3 [Datura stramonium]
VNFFLLLLPLGVRTKDTERQGKVSQFAKLQLTSPVCTSKGEKIALSRRIEKHWRLIGWGQIQAGITLDKLRHALSK